MKVRRETRHERDDSLTVILSRAEALRLIDALEGYDDDVVFAPSDQERMTVTVQRREIILSGAGYSATVSGEAAGNFADKLVEIVAKRNEKRENDQQRDTPEATRMEANIAVAEGSPCLFVKVFGELPNGQEVAFAEFLLRDLNAQQKWLIETQEEISSQIALAEEEPAASLANTGTQRKGASGGACQNAGGNARGNPASTVSRRLF